VLVRHRVTRLPVPDLDRAVLRVQDRVAQECRVHPRPWEVRAARAGERCRNADRATQKEHACECEQLPHEGLFPRLATRLTLPPFGSTVPGLGFSEMTRLLLTVFE